MKIIVRNFKKFFLLTFLISSYCYAAEDSLYNFSWLDPDKEVYVLQNRKYRKANRIHINAAYGLTTSSAFTDSSSIQGRAGYFFTENWGAEFLYSKNNGKENTTAQSVRNPGGAGSTPFRRITNNYMGGILLWSPFYAKINTFNKILYFDWIIGAGYGKIEEHNNRTEFESGGTTNTGDVIETHNAYIWQTGLQFWCSENFIIRADYTSLHYEAVKALSTATEKAYFNNSDLTLGVGYTF
jgi:outer membrane beta-barrel protein